MSNSVLYFSWFLFIASMLIMNYVPANILNSSNNITKDRAFLGGLVLYYSVYGFIILLLFRQGQAAAKEISEFY